MRPSVLAAIAALVTHAPAAPAAPPECRATAEGVPALLLARARQAVGMPDQPGSVLRWRSHRSVLQAYQSDRTYAPFFSMFTSNESWLAPTTGAQRTHGMGGAYPGGALPSGRFPQLATDRAEWIGRDSTWMPLPDRSQSAVTRPLDPWAVLADFTAAADARVTGRCRYRDFPRVAIERKGGYGAETLLLDPKSWVPVALVRREPHVLFGQVQVEYVWSNWDAIEGGTGLFPLTTFRQVIAADGSGETAPLYAETEISVTVTDAALVPADSAPPLAVPDTALAVPATNSAFWRPERPDTVRFAPRGILLVNRFYTTAALLERDTLYVLDATLSEARARQDSAWIATAFPGRYPIVLVVTDLAWPHIGGVRFWAANGATIVTHRAARGFLSGVIERRWSLDPDRLERERPARPVEIRPVTDSLVLAGGAVRIHAIDGAATEGALLVWLPGSRFLWPGDYIQNTSQPSGYAREVLRATRRLGIVPERFAAQHVPLTPWRVVDSLHPDEPTPAVSARDVNAESLRLGRLARWTTITRGGASRDAGAREQVLSRTRYRGREALVSVQEFQTAAGLAVDSSVADATTLAPIRHVGVHRSRTLVLDFDGARVAGRHAPDGGAELPIDQALGARPYDASLYDVVVASLPLAAGYQARLPFYVFEQGGLVWYDATVEGVDTLALRDGSRAETWRVKVTEDGGHRADLWISRSGPREVLRATAYFGGGTATTTR